MQWYLIGLVAVAAGSVVWPLVAKRNCVLAGYLAALVPAALCGWLLLQSRTVAAGVLPQFTANWVPQMGVAFDLRLNGVGLLLSILVSGIGALILIYAGSYLKNSPQAAPFFAFVQLFMLAMLGIACADNLLVLFVFWELTSLTSYLLIGLDHSSAAARKAALRALLVTGTGGLALLAGILLLGAAGDSYSLAVLQERGDMVRSSPLYVPIFILVVLGAFTKSAQVPFHFWLPDAMAAPTPVSAYLHSATMVKAGVFLLAQLLPVLGGTALWHDVLALFGAITMLMGGIFALGQTDLKRLLAYSTMSVLGTLVMLLGMGTALAIQAAMVFLVVHALYKAPLFMIAGVVDKATGTRNVTQLQGLGKCLPLVAITAVGAAFSMSGIPPFVGFIGKELLYEAEMNASQYALIITALGFIANAINVAVALKVGVSPFQKRAQAIPQIKPAARSLSLVIGPLLLVVAGIVVGIFPQVLGDGLINAAVRDIVRTPVQVELKLWHGFSLLLAISVVTVAVGLLLYRHRDWVRSFTSGGLNRAPLSASRDFDNGLATFIGGAGILTRFIQHGNLRIYIVVILACLAALVVAAIASTGLAGLPHNGPVRFVALGVSVLMVVGAVAAIRSRSAVMAVLAMGSVGYGVALLFAEFGAPDLALTQVLVETLTLALFALLIRQLPPLHNYSTPVRRRTDAVIAALAGLTVVAALLAVRLEPMANALRASAAMAARSLPEAFGKNVVNVILVDFRAFDTMGEICVLAIAALGVAGLLMGDGKRSVRAELSVATKLFCTASRWLMPLMLFISVILLFRGHNEPGGGFIGGLVAGSAFALRRLATARHPLHAQRKPLLLIAAGVLAALISTLPSVLSDQVFMKGVWAQTVFWMPFVGKVKFGTPFLFDVGVYLVVIGATLLILTRLIRKEAVEV